MLQTQLQGPFIILIPFIYLMFTWKLFCEDLELQLNLSTTATFGTEESGCCREVETRVNVWTVHQKKKKNDCCREVAIVERWQLVDV